MDSLMKADIFFVIASIATVLVALFFCVLMFYVIRAAKHLSKITETLKTNIDASEEYVAELADRLEDNALFRFFFPPKRTRRTTKSK